jgi:threonine dehydratase
MSSQSPEDLKNGVVCASAGNHAQGVAFACNKLQVHGKIFMPSTTPKQKIGQVKLFGKSFVEVILVGDTFDDSYKEALEYTKVNKMKFIHPFNDPLTIAGQGTIGVEVLEDLEEPIDYVFVPVGGGGLVSGLGSYFKQVSPLTKIIGVEPLGAPSMKEALKEGHVVNLDHIDKFIDGAAVKAVGDITFKIAQEVVEDMVLVPEGKDCSTILKLYNEEAIVVEPAGALSIAALDFYADKIKGKNVVCIVSGSNNDISRMQEIIERSLIYEGLKHYFIVRFTQRPGALREFLNEVLGPNDDITRFEYIKKGNKDQGPALVGIELKYKEDYEGLLERMDIRNIQYTIVNEDPDLFNIFL